MNNILEELLNVDRQFDKSVSTGGAEAWASYFHNDGVMVTSGSEDVIKGKDNIYLAMKDVFSTKDFSLRWEPLSSDISDCGSMGYTYGVYKRKYRNDNNELITSTGKYTSIWKKDEYGNWKVILDIGN